MKKMLLLMLMLVSPLISHTQDTRKEEPYFQYVYEKYIITANIGIQSSLRFTDYHESLQIYPSVPINLDIFYRFTSANIFGYSGVLFELPFFNNNISENFYGGVFIGLGWYVFDHRDITGLGWSMMQALAGSFYIMNDHLGGGVRLISRFNYSFHENVALNLGLDLDYAAVKYKETFGRYEFDSLYHILSLGFNVGLTFYFNSN